MYYKVERDLGKIVAYQKNESLCLGDKLSRINTEQSVRCDSDVVNFNSTNVQDNPRLT